MANEDDWVMGEAAAPDKYELTGYEAMPMSRNVVDIREPIPFRPMTEDQIWSQQFERNWKNRDIPMEPVGPLPPIDEPMLPGEPPAPIQPSGEHIPISPEELRAILTEGARDPTDKEIAMGLAGPKPDPWGMLDSAAHRLALMQSGQDRQPRVRSTFDEHLRRGYPVDDLEQAYTYSGGRRW